MKMSWFLTQDKCESSSDDNKEFADHARSRVENRALMVQHALRFSIVDVLYDAMFWFKVKIRNLCTCQCICQ